MINSRNFLLLLAGLGLLPALGLVFLTIFLVYVPAWQIFLGWSSPLLAAGLLLFLFPFLLHVRRFFSLFPFHSRRILLRLCRFRFLFSAQSCCRGRCHCRAGRRR